MKHGECWGPCSARRSSVASLDAGRNSRRAPCVLHRVRREPADHAARHDPEVEWINPHAFIHLDVKRDDGTVEKWMIEAGSPNTLVRRGMTRDSIPAGTEVVVFGYRHRNGSNAANGRDVTLPDGRRLFITSPGTGAPAAPEATQ